MDKKEKRVSNSDNLPAKSSFLSIKYTKVLQRMFNTIARQGIITNAVYTKMCLVTSKQLLAS